MPKKSQQTLKRKARSKISVILIVLPVLLIGLLVSFFFDLGLRKDCANSRTCTRDLSGNYEAQGNEGVFLGQKVYASANSIVYEDGNILGDTDASQKRIEIDLTNQKSTPLKETPSFMSFLFQAENGGRHRPVIFGSG